MNLATTISLLQAKAIFHHVQILGFSRPDEERIRAAVSRVPPELLSNVNRIISDPTLGAKHGRFDPDTKTIIMNPVQFDLRQRFGRGPGWIWHFELTMVHEVGHSVYQGLDDERKKEWEALSGWTQCGDNVPAGYLRYTERRPGWDVGKKSDWAHKSGVGFTRHYAERNPGEDFADSFGFYIMGKPAQMSPEKREYLRDLINSKVHNYPQTAIEGPNKAYGERELLWRINAGGPGSGCHGPNCGRKGGEKVLSERAQRAKASYKPSTLAKQVKSAENQLKVALACNGVSLPDKEPFDVLKASVGVEVKTIVEAGNDKITMHPSSLERKLKEAKEIGLKHVYTVAIDNRGGGEVIYYKKGLGSFRLGAMERVSSFKDLARVLK